MPCMLQCTGGKSSNQEDEAEGQAKPKGQNREMVSGGRELANVWADEKETDITQTNRTTVIR